MRETPRRAPAAVVALLALVTGLVLAASAQGATALLPDLDPAAPGNPRAYAATDGSGRVFLSFNATFDNVGTGPFILRGHRSSTSVPTMVADQVVKQDDGTETTIPAVGSLYWDTEYRRWGFAPYIAYELRGVDGSLVGTGPDLNFCVMDTKNTNKRVLLPGEPSSKVYRSCGSSRSGASLLAIEEGISVGWGNLHAAGNKGQMIDITTLPSGRYVLVHRVNTAGLFTEASLANNASSALVSITWVSGQTLPTVTRVRTCPATETCS